jgi:glutamate/aspartate transport system permease protein
MMSIFDWRVIVANFPFLMQGLLTTAKLAAVSIAGGLVLGTLVGMARLSPRKWLYYPATLFVFLLRSIPLILVIFWFYFLVPIISGRPLGNFLSAAIAFIVFEAAHFAEIVRAGIQSIRVGQKQAGLSSGLTGLQTFIHILLPQALRNMLPSLLTQSIVIFQDTSLAYVIGLQDFLTATSIVDAREVRSLELYLFAALVYFIVCSGLSRLARNWETKRSKKNDRNKGLKQMVWVTPGSR